MKSVQSHPIWHHARARESAEEVKRTLQHVERSDFIFYITLNITWDTSIQQISSVYNKK